MGEVRDELVAEVLDGAGDGARRAVTEGAEAATQDVVTDVKELVEVLLAALSLLEAAEDLGCPPIRAFWKITFPLSLPGVVAGCFLVFIPVTGEFVIPDLLGGSDTLMIGKTLWSEFFSNRDWPLASTVAVVLLLTLVVPIVLFQHHEMRRTERETSA